MLTAIAIPPYRHWPLKAEGENVDKFVTVKKDVVIVVTLQFQTTLLPLRKSSDLLMGNQFLEVEDSPKISLESYLKFGSKTSQKCKNFTT